MSKTSLYQQLKQDIRQGIWPAGTVLNQQKLSDYYQVSRIPVRDALQQLKAEALLIMAGKASLMVPPLTATEAEELYHIRLQLEPMALRRAFPNLTFAVLGQAEDLLRQLEQDHHLSAADRGAMNWQFHLMLYQASQCPHLLRLLHSLHQQVERYLGFQEISMNYAQTSQQEHWQLLQLLRSQQLDAAVDLLQQHIQQAGELLVAHLRLQQPATPTNQSGQSY